MISVSKLDFFPSAFSFSFSCNNDSACSQNYRKVQVSMVTQMLAALKHHMVLSVSELQGNDICGSSLLSHRPKHDTKHVNRFSNTLFYVCVIHLHCSCVRGNIVTVSYTHTACYAF